MQNIDIYTHSESCGRPLIKPFAGGPGLDLGRSTLLSLRRLALLAGLLLSWPASSAMATVHVTTTAWGVENDDECSLVEAIHRVQGTGSSPGCSGTGPIIRLQGNGAGNPSGPCPTSPDFCTYEAEDQYPAIIGDVRIQGAFATIKRAAGSDHRFFEVIAGGHLELLWLTLKGGTAMEGGAIKVNPGGHLVVDRSSLIGNTADQGGAIFSHEGTVELPRRVRAAHNFARRDGGAIFVKGGSLTVDQSTFDRNEAALEVGLDRAGLPHSMGGAIYSELASVDVRNTTFAENSAGTGGAWFAAGGPSMELTQSTLKDNRSILPGSALATDFGGDAKILVRRSALDCPTDPCAASSCTRSSGSCEVDLCSGQVSSLAHNVIEDGSCGNPSTTDRFDTDPLLVDSPQLHGGPTPIYPMASTDSPLFDQYACSDRDQRGVLRGIQGGELCDIGAYEAVCSLLTPGAPPEATTEVGILMGVGVRSGVEYSVFNDAACSSLSFEAESETLEWFLDVAPAGNFSEPNPFGFVWVSRVIFLAEKCDFDCVQQPDRCREFCAVAPPAGFEVPSEACVPAPSCDQNGPAGACCQKYSIGVDLDSLVEDAYPYMLEFGSTIPGEGALGWDPEMKRPDPPDLESIDLELLDLELPEVSRPGLASTLRADGLTQWGTTP